MLEFATVGVKHSPRAEQRAFLPSGTANMTSILASVRSWFGRPSEDTALVRAADESKSRGLFRPFQRAAAEDAQTPITDLLVALRESMERQSQRHEELMIYLSHLPKAMELIPENSKLQSEALAAIRQHLENQGTQARQMSTILDKVGQATIDQRRILDAVRQRLDMLAENDQKVAEHFSSFAAAMSTSNDTTRLAGEVLRSMESNIRQRDEALERILQVHQRRHTWMLAAAIVLAAAALVASAVGLLVVSR